ncbi:hypothetical protein Fmac_015135 [Flemingia macrophylla]|uniref:Uncharacterized protein n=1 Tax=Flemingia macrophylla TaxID=520843 RepID=A0ABD1MDT7_9FABA
MMEEGETQIDNVYMFPFHHTVLMMCIRTNQHMSDAMIIQKISKRSEFPSPIRLNTFNFGV